MKKLFSYIILIICSAVYIFCMNSTENRQRLEDESSLAYTGFRDVLSARYPNDSNDMIYRCYSAYSSLVHMHPNQYCYDEAVKDKLVTTGYCDLDDGSLVLRGFHIEDTLSVLVGRMRIKR